jgi:hypothetical protein
MSDHDATIDPEAAAQAAYDGCVSFYPLVLLDQARRQHPAPANQFHHDGRLGRHCIAHPNPLVLYSTAWLDLGPGPVVLSLPNLGARQVLVSMIDARGRVFSSAGARATGVVACEIAIVGPRWFGGVGLGLNVVRAPTERVWLVARTPIDPEAPRIAPALHRGLHLTPIRGAGVTETAADPVCIADDWPARTVATMDGRDFLGRLGGLLEARPASRADAKIMEALRRIGVVPGRRFDPRRLPARVAEAVRDGVTRALADIAAAPLGDGSAPWASLALERGRADDPLDEARRVHACIGLNLKDDAIYFLAERDSDGQPLNGTHRYRLHFNQFHTPQVEGDWSLTAYDLNGELPALPGGRLGLSGRDRLRFNADGSIDLRIQHNSPLDPLAANWTPCPPRDFRLVLRAYWPRHSLLSGFWRPPAVRRLREFALPADEWPDPPSIEIAAVAPNPQPSTQGSNRPA